MIAQLSSSVFPGMEECRAPISGGRLRYLVGGSGPPLILVHGIAASSFSFRFNCAELMREFRVFLPDLLSVGYHPALDVSLRGTATRLREFMDQVGLKRANILGSSHGGSVVMELAALNPQGVECLVLVSPANPFAVSYHSVVQFYLSALGSIFIGLAPFMPGFAWDYGIGRMYADPSGMVPGSGIGYARSLRTKGAVPHIRSCLRTFKNDIEGLKTHLPVLAELPTLLIWGDRDPVVELESAYQLQRALAAELVVMQNVGHLPYEESPANFNRAVSDWLKSQSRDRHQQNATVCGPTDHMT